MPPAGAIRIYSGETPRRHKHTDGSVESSVRRSGRSYAMLLFQPDLAELAQIREQLAAGQNHIQVARAWGIGNGKDSARLRRLLVKPPPPPEELSPGRACPPSPSDE